MGVSLLRHRLLDALDRRHQLTLCALVAPAGFGRTVLLHQATAGLDPERRDIHFRCTPEDARPGQLADRLTETLARASGGRVVGPRPHDLAGSVDQVTSAMVACDARLPTALCLDRFELTGPAGTDLIRRLVADAPPGVHLVVSARHLEHVGLGRLVVAGRALLMGWRQLAFTPDELSLLGVPEDESTWPGDEPAIWPALASLQLEGSPELVTDYLRHEVLMAEPKAVVRALAALAAIGGCAADDLTDATGPVVEDLSPDRRHDIIDRVAELPLVGRGSVGCWPHPMWVRATRSVLGDDERRQVIAARVSTLLQRGEVSEAGRMAVEAGSPDALRSVVRVALSPMPVTASVTDLRAWQRADLVPSHLPERTWLDAVLRSRVDDESLQFLRLEEVRVAFEARNDVDGEVGVLLHLGNLARVRGDVGALATMLERARVLAASGDERAISLVALGRALGAQLAGRPAEAVRAVDSVLPGSLPADWAAQALMIRGTNLLLDGRVDAAVASLEAATGEGSEGTMATAHDLLSTARWQAGDAYGALDDARLSVALSAPSGPPSRLHLSQSWLACLLAATGQGGRATAVLEEIHSGGPVLSTEATALAAVAEALLRIDDHDAARALLESAAVPDRPVRSSLWRRALLEALAPVGTAAQAGQPLAGFERAVQAGEAGREVLAGGPPAGGRHRPYLPVRWCVPNPASTTVSLFGVGTVRRDHQVVEHPAWQRSRVRELCLHLAMVDRAARSHVAMALWPDRSERAAGQNLRVTLSHLLDVLDPDRERSQGSHLLQESGGAIRLDPDSGLRVDLWEVQRHAGAVITASEDRRSSVLAHARRLLAARTGPLLDATQIGDWYLPHQRRLDDLVLTAAGRAGELALGTADMGLAIDLGHLVLAIDPWAEHGHRLVIEGRLIRGDRDGARRALLEANSLLDDLGVTPGRPLILLAHRLGLTSRPRGTGGERVDRSAVGRTG